MDPIKHESKITKESKKLAGHDQMLEHQDRRKNVTKLYINFLDNKLLLGYLTLPRRF